MTDPRAAINAEKTRRGLSDYRMSQLTCRPPRTVNDYLSGRSGGSNDLIAALLAALGMTIDLKD